MLRATLILEFGDVALLAVAIALVAIFLSGDGYESY